MTEMKARLVDKDGNPLGTAANPLKISGDVGGGVPDGGTTGQVLQKKTDADQDTEWGDVSVATTSWGSITGTLADQTDLNMALGGKVPTTRTVNSKALSSDISLTPADVGAQPADATLTAFAGITTAANKLPYATGEDTFGVCDFTPLGQSLIGTTTALAIRDLIASASSTTATQNIYVDSAATGAGTGADWTNAFTTIQAAINSLPAIISHTVSIIVRKGSTAYSESLTIKRVIGAGQIIIRGEYYWNGTNTSSKTGKIDLGSGDTGYAVRAQIAAGDKVILMKYSGTVNASLPSDSYVDTVASVSGTEVTLTTNTGVAFDTTWAYTIVKTSLSGPSTTTLTITGTPSVSLFGLDITSGTYASVYAINSRGVSITGCYLYGAGSSIVTAINKSDVSISNSFVGSSANSAYGIYASVQSYVSLITTVITMTTTGTYAINASYLSAISAQYNRISAAATGFIAQRNSFVYVGSVNDNGATTPKNPATSTDAARIE